MPLPVILAFHGGGGGPFSFDSLTQFSEKATAQGFIVVYPKSYKGGWNASEEGGSGPKGKIDDVAFVSAIIDDLSLLFRLNPQRIFATGFSSGGMFTYRLAVELSERVAAIAVVASSLGVLDMKPKRPVPLLHIHGTHDRLVPFSGGCNVGGSKSTGQAGGPRTIARWIEWNGLTGVFPIVQRQGKLTFMTYQSTSSRAYVVVCIVEGLGHQWPGGTGVHGLNPRNNEVSATQMIIQFLFDHPRTK